MIDDKMKEEWAEIATQAFIGKADGTMFRNFLFQPVIKQALARYVHSEAREALWYSMSERYGKRGPTGHMVGPAWLDAATAEDSDESDKAYYALELALQEEVEKRVAAALAEAKAQTKQIAGLRLRELTRHLVTVVRRGAAEQQASDFADTEQAMEAAGLKSKARKKPTAVA